MKRSRTRSQPMDEMIARFNESTPIGTRVCVRRDDGTQIVTETRSAASIVGDQPVIWLEGITGCYDLSRVSVWVPPYLGRIKQVHGLWQGEDMRHFWDTKERADKRAEMLLFLLDQLEAAQAITEDSLWASLMLSAMFIRRFENADEETFLAMARCAYARCHERMKDVPDPLEAEWQAHLRKHVS